MSTGRVGLFVAVGAAALAAGCVDRRFVVETNVPGAQVAIDGQPIGPAPCDGRWEYAGWYEFTAVAPGYDMLVQRVRFAPKWYNWPGLDFLAEVVWPFRIEDVRRVQLTLQPFRPANQADLVAAADALRARGYQLPPSYVRDEVPPDQGNRPPPRAPGATPPGPTLPATQEAIPRNMVPFIIPGGASPPLPNLPPLDTGVPTPAGPSLPLGPIPGGR